MYLFFSFYSRYIISCTLWPFDVHCTYIWFIYILMHVISPISPCVGLYIYWCMLFHLSLYVLFLFSLYTLISYLLYAIYYFCFTLRCLVEFCLKCLRNTGCQSLLAINSLLAKFFKSLCLDRFYCIQQASMSWVIYDFSNMFICLLWFCHGLPKGEIVRTYVIWC